LKPMRRISPAGTYFVTFSTCQRRQLFTVDSYARLFLKILYTYEREGIYRLHAFVVMPEHVHLLVTPGPDITLEKVMQRIKGGYSRAFGLTFRPGEVWQRGFTDHRVRDAEDFGHHVRYIHQNPVQRGLVRQQGEYRWCSAFPGFRLDAWPVESRHWSQVAVVSTEEANLRR